MSAGPLVVELILVLALTVFLLHKYGDWRRQHFIVSLATLIAWYFAFIIVFILPLDVVLAFYKACEGSSHPIHNNSFGGGDQSLIQNGSIITTTTPVTTSVHPFPTSNCKVPSSYIPSNVLPRLWRVVYWSSQVLTWLVLPLMQSYSQSGAFTALGKLKSALVDNAIYYGSYLLIFGVLLIYVAAIGLLSGTESLKVILITASNTWGMFWLILLLGYGLVEVPRQTWLSGSKGYRLNKTYFDVEKLSTEKNDSEESLKDAYLETKSALESYRDGHPMKANAEIIMRKFTPAIMNLLMKQYPSLSASSNTTSVNVTTTANSPNEKELVRLHKSAILALGNYNRCQAQWADLLDRALHLEDVSKNEQQSALGAKGGEFVRTYKKIRSPILEALCTPRIEWYWECMLKRPLVKALAIFLALFSTYIVWSEVTFFSVHPRLSLAAVFVHLAAANADYGYIELSSILTIMYMCVCAYFTVFRIKIYRYYHLDPHHHTDERSLLFSAILLCRLTPPLCLNFLGMIHLDNHVTEDAGIAATAYTTIMGHLDVIRFIAKGFNVYFPMAILLLCVATYFRLGTRCLHYIGFDQFLDNADEMTVELVQGGKSIVMAERNRLTRQTEREARTEFWREKLGDHVVGGAQAASETRGTTSNRSFGRRDRDFDSNDAGLYGGQQPFQATEPGPFDYRQDPESGGGGGGGASTNDPSGWLKSGSRSNSTNRFSYGSSPHDDQKAPSKSSSKNFFDDL